MSHIRNKRLSTVASLPKFKVVLLGEVGVGKSSLFMRLKEGVFGEGCQPTVGIESCSKVVSVDEEKIIFQVWDTAGVERYRTLTRNYYRNTHATFLMYSLDNPASLHYLAKWIDDSKDAAPNALIFLIGNKADLERSIPEESVTDFATAHDCDGAYIVSAKSGNGIEEALCYIGQKLLDTYKTPSFSESLFDDNCISMHTNSGNQTSSTCPC